MANDGKGGTDGATNYMTGLSRPGEGPLDATRWEDADKGTKVYRTNDLGKLISTPDMNGNIPGGTP
jgi:hypothetical protein